MRSIFFHYKNHSFINIKLNADQSYLISATMKIQEDCQDCNWLHFYDVFNLIPLASFLRICGANFALERIENRNPIIGCYDSHSNDIGDNFRFLMTRLRSSVMIHHFN